MNNTANDSTKIYKILAYISILWIIGLLVQEKNDPKVRFHVGQGILLNIYFIAVYIIAIVVAVIMFIIGGIISGIIGTLISVLAGFLIFAAWVSWLVLAIMGILSVIKGTDKPLPLIGKFAFYK